MVAVYSLQWKKYQRGSFRKMFSFGGSNFGVVRVVPFGETKPISEVSRRFSDRESHYVIRLPDVARILEVKANNSSDRASCFLRGDSSEIFLSECDIFEISQPECLVRLRALQPSTEAA
jgi:hypothetical protein